ncbi:MAG: BolA family protein [Alphaproteobacteria bacterium]
MTSAIQIEYLLKAAFSPISLTVVDDSAKHAGHAGARPGGKTHFSIAIEAEAFRGKSRIEAHRMVYAALDGLFEQGLHALAIEVRAPSFSPLSVEEQKGANESTPR